MEKMTKLLCMLALGAAMAISMVSCQKEEPAAPEIPDTSVKGVTITIGAGIDDGLTKSAVNQDGSTRSLIFTEYDQLYVFGEIDDETRVAGLLDMKDGTLSLDGKSAQFTGTIKAYDVGGSEKTYDFGGSDPLALCVKTAATGTLVQDGNSDIGAVIISNGTEPQIHYDAMVADDVNTLMEKGLYVHGAYNSSKHSFALSTEVPIFNCTIGGLTASTYYRAYLKKDGSGSDGVLFQTNASGVGAFAFGTGLSGNGAYTVEIKDNNTSTLAGTIDLGTKDIAAKVYNLSRYWNGTEFRAYTNLASIDIASLPAENSYPYLKYYTVSDGDVLTGTFPSDCELKVPADATVVLAGVTHHAGRAVCGIECLGTANLILAAGTINDLTYADEYAYDGICAYGDLILSGTGTLLASGGSDFSGIGGSCRDIVINGGNITVTGGYQAAGIGASMLSSVGDITINGGTITVTGGEKAGGIGCGFSDSPFVLCGDITFNGGSVTIYAGASGWGVGLSKSKPENYRCGDIKFVGGSVTAYGDIRTKKYEGKGNIYIDDVKQDQVYIIASDAKPFIYPVPATP